MEIWQGLGKLCEGSEDLRKQKIEVLLEKLKSFKMLPGESFDMLDERFHKILNDLASLNHILSPKEKNVRLLRSLPTEWYTNATTMEEGRNLENYTLQGLLDELRTYEHELMKKKEEQVTPFPTALLTTPRVPPKDDTLCLMAKDDVDQEVTSQTSCSSSYESIPTSESLFDKFKMMMEDFEKINLKHSSLTEENKLLSEENLKLTKGRKSQPDEITQLKTENESLSEKLKSLNKELGILKSKRKGRTTFIPPKPTAKHNKQKGKEKEKSREVPKKKLEAKCSSQTFYQSYLEMIAAQELSGFLHMEIRFKYENKVLEFYKNGKVKTVQSKKSPQRTIQIIKSTVGGAKVKISQKKLKEKLHLPNTGSEIGRLPTKNLDWKTIGISGQIPSGPTKKSDLKNDYKLVLELVIACFECGSGGHANDITQESAFIINALITKSKRAWKVGNSAEQLLRWDQQLKNEKIIKKCLGLPVNYCCEQILDVDWVWQRNYEDLHLEHLATSPISEFEADDEDPSVYKPIFSKETEDQMTLTIEAQVNMEAIAEDFQVFLENFLAFETVLPEAVRENAASPQQEQSQTTSEEELLQLLQSHVQEILTTPCEISNQPELEIPEKSEENLEKSTPPETNEVQEDQVVEVQRSSAEAEKEAQMGGLETSETPDAIFEQNIGEEERDSLSRDISNFVLNETEEESEKTLKIDDEQAEQGDVESLPLQLFHRAPSSHQVVIQDYLKVIAENQKEAFRLFRHFGTYTRNRKIDVIVQHNSPSLIPQLPIEVKKGELTYIPSHLNMTELILEAQQSNPENSTQHLTDSSLDGSEVVGTIASHFSYDAQTKERYNNLRHIKEQCGIIQGIGETAESSKRMKQ
ncbi:unnamed protein product [Cuscuta campestris]|uniref:Uncharacterized protein n=1 Tax=Cuscuta campestris TaxID=132261 RepID=A0A484L3F6_9ASTE|nr:unnamed protein product [Cuscuta campestris]